MPIFLKRKAERDSQRAARRHRLEAGIKGTLADGLDSHAFSCGAAAPGDIGYKPPGGEGFGLDTDRLFPKIVQEDIPIQGFYTAGFQGDR